MFDFPILINLLIVIVIFYFTIYFNLKKEIDDYKNTSSMDNKNIKLKIGNRKNKLLLLNFITIILLSITIILYFLPSIVNIFNNNESIGFSNIGIVFSKLFPFRKGFFSDANFKFSFITGLILSLIVDFIVCVTCIYVFEPKRFAGYIPIVIILIILSLGLIWINNYISLFFTYCIIHCFELLSIILNILAYTLIVVLIFYIFVLS